MGRVRKRHVQTELIWVTRGGRRAGAGRKPKGREAGESHDRRPEVSPRHPLHVSTKLTRAIGNLRRHRAYAAIRAALRVALRRADIRVVHMSIQANHLHLIVEADSAEALSRGMQAFQISAAKRLNAEAPRVGGVRRKGKVFEDRYHAEAITCPRFARNAVAYVLNNWRRHHEDEPLAARSWRVDPYSSGISFDGWKEHPGPWPVPDGYEPLPVAKPTCWLLRAGWRQRGRTISLFETPGPWR
jgi:REP element-mobilizing transposase RayT